MPNGCCTNDTVLAVNLPKPFTDINFYRLIGPESAVGERNRHCSCAMYAFRFYMGAWVAGKGVDIDLAAVLNRILIGIQTIADN